VDVGVHQDGLVHVSELADRFVSDPREVVRTGQTVKVRVLSVDRERNRVALSMRSKPREKAEPGADRKATTGPAPARKGPPSPRQAPPPRREEGAMADALRKALGRG
jgi:uncharacterized protein